MQARQEKYEAGDVGGTHSIMRAAQSANAVSTAMVWGRECVCPSRVVRVILYSGVYMISVISEFPGFKRFA
ncbi:MAG: hypothetical protein KKD69_00075 [Euryarchaeota archaeon]|nr:hypothetical protein [Euryarchaeota archaeon]MBU4490846.1 hypothetical protein [Euryarchaeota archaeon]MCG2728515.1 hypothetical protein [Candidatus Methanoperedenaceae archaeon]